MKAPDYTARWRDRGYVDRYIRFTRPVRFDGAKWAEKLCVGSNDTVVDLGCGDGKLLLALAPYIRRGIGIDVSAPAIEYAQRNLADSGAENVEFIECDFRELALPVGSINAAVSLAALHHVSDDEKLAVLRSVAEALVAGGLFQLEDDTFNFAPDAFETMAPAMYRQFEERFGSKAWAFMRDELAGEDFEFTPYLESLLSMIRAAGLDVISVSELGLNGAVIRARKPSV
ncbi:MAG TPA: methyltransferase domain-containing protein [Candidatus Binataceae bacterium]|nr:methyltransferase domain-containing protein [Candidatus Binataceae bacterium]